MPRRCTLGWRELLSLGLQGAEKAASQPVEHEARARGWVSSWAGGDAGYEGAFAIVFALESETFAGYRLDSFSS